MRTDAMPAEGGAATLAPAKSLLRFLTCGSVDDGKSTLIGRLLHEAGQIPEDQLAALERDSRRHGTTGEEIDLALLVDGLEAERQQGITIDVAYRYFSTPRRGFIVADTPGHEQYTRNMATGASNSELAVILVDVRKGVLPQTRRHSHIAALFGVRHVILAVNKMDMVDFDEATFRAVVADYEAFAERLGFASLVAVPLSARYGDNVTTRSARTPWWDGPALVERLETVDVDAAPAERPLRFPVQWVNRPDQSFRGFSGTLASGRVRVGDPVVVAASGRESRVARIVTYDGDLAAAQAGDAVTLVLADEVDVARGDVLASPQARPEVIDQFAARVLWMAEAPMLPGRPYLMKIGARYVPCQVTELKHRLDVNSFERLAGKTLALNDIAECNLATAAPIPIDAFADDPVGGAFVLIDRYSNATVGAGTVLHGLRRATNVHQQALLVDRPARERLKGHRSGVLWFTGLSGSGKSTVANLVERELHARGVHTFILDGDNLRHGLNRDLGFTVEDRVENIRRVGEVAKLFLEAGVLVLCSFISPFRAERRMVRELFAEGEFLEIFMDAPIETCIARDPKGLYAKALGGEIKNFTGVDSPYERPQAPEMAFDTAQATPEAAAAAVIAELEARGLI
ncbi:sulfate adenylyltransferase subunit CysN [Caulobacter sp. 17J65-9]|uniref:sulfate adenylyltransferase subunit CysN n=1 Tax=Caulobacter sp. 17J65-9 TaxID=2709382 RepID=UPI0013CB83F2|nr:sulfate adenylyltransferase subunit CysN [Caulobacter sp. 17J65-9]NEX93029.1 sulfate adenylyltransferase subunit CysN [Caulobacter sp. 17J65-9]